MQTASALGELLTRGTIWITLSAYLLGSVVFHLKSVRNGRNSLTRGIWTIALLALVLHFVAAYQYYHDWNQTSAYLETARQTNDYIGLNWGGGLYINYAILLIWIVDLSLWWLQGPDSYQKHFWKVRLVWHWLLIFIIFNALIVFKGGMVRWIGILYCSVLIFTWLPIRPFWSRRLNS
jgi:hypothetical protein